MSKPLRKTSVGGQALIEGIMMQGPRGMALSVRTPQGEIDTQYKDVTHLKDKHKFFGLPLIRGVVSFAESMVIGYKCLMHSAEIATEIEEDDEEEMTKFDKFISDKFGDKLIGVVSTIGAVLGVLLAFALFFLIPVLIFKGLNTWTNGAMTPYQGLIEGILKILMFVAYLALVAQMKEINRTFQYHGAEHKTIFCYENGLDLTVENVRKQSRFHPRCGTSFIFIILILSIVLSTVLTKIFPTIASIPALWVIVKLAFIPLLMGIGYEFIKYAGRHNNIIVRICSAPGLWMQRITTKEPKDDSIIEVGIAALKAVITDNPEDDEIK